MLTFLDHQFKDRWKFKVSLPAEDNDKLFKAIRNIQYIDPNTIETTYTPGKTLASFEVTDYSFSEWLKDHIRRVHTTWWYTVDYISEPITVSSGFYEEFQESDEEFKERFKNIMADYVLKKEDTTMSKVKTQAPTWYASCRKFTKVIRSGPVTVAWIDGKKVMIRKTKKDKDDLEKAMLMLYAKKQFVSEASFHRWFRDQMDIFKEADKNAKN